MSWIKEHNVQIGYKLATEAFGPQELIRQRQHARRSVAGVRDERAAEVVSCRHAGQPPASAERKDTLSPVASGVSPSRVI